MPSHLTAIARALRGLLDFFSPVGHGCPSVGAGRRAAGAEGFDMKASAFDRGATHERSSPAEDGGEARMPHWQAHAPVAILTLGEFRVLRNAHPVSASTWQSRKARELLKMVVARRGHPTRREHLMAGLWPDEDPQRLSNRFSVALSIVRRVLDTGHGDPIRGDHETVALDLEVVPVDVEYFLAAARKGQRLCRARHPGGTALLQMAAGAYAGDFLQDDEAVAWSTPLREEARAVFIIVVRLLAEEAANRDDHDTAGQFLRRILGCDPYDEGAHLALVAGLVRARRHGEARRSYNTYVRKMREIDVQPATFPASGARPVGAA